MHNPGGYIYIYMQFALFDSKKIWSLMITICDAVAIWLIFISRLKILQNFKNTK